VCVYVCVCVCEACLFVCLFGSTRIRLNFSQRNSDGVYRGKGEFRSRLQDTDLYTLGKTSTASTAS
jgi:hypothetical protein